MQELSSFEKFKQKQQKSEKEGKKKKNENPLDSVEISNVDTNIEYEQDENDEKRATFYSISLSDRKNKMKEF